MTGYNWRNTLNDFAAISSVLAGFSITFIALILGGSLAETELIIIRITFGELSILFFGISAGLFICSAEFFLKAKTFDIFSIPKLYYKLLISSFEKQNTKEREFLKEQTSHCRRYEKYARMCYNCSIFILFGGVFFVIAPYNLFIAIIVSCLGISLQLLQLIFRIRKKIENKATG